MMRRRLLPGVVTVAVVAAITGCLPLPNTLTVALCPADPVPVAPAIESPTVDVLLQRLFEWPAQLSVATTPTVTVQLPASGRAEATALRKDFGPTIDIQLGNKRLGGGPSGNPDSCLIRAPRWAIWPSAPSGVDVTIVPAPGGFDRHQTVEATLRVTNRTKRSIRVQGHVSNEGCGLLGVPALSRPGTALAANVSEGVPANDDPGFRAARSFGTLGPGYEGGPPITRFITLGCITYLPQPTVTVRRGASVDLHVTTTAVSAEPGDDPFLAAGQYDLRAVVNVSTSLLPSEPLVAVGAPPTRVELHD